MKEHKFREFNLANRFESEIWEPFLRKQLVTFTISTRKKEKIYTFHVSLIKKGLRMTIWIIFPLLKNQK